MVSAFSSGGNTPQLPQQNMPPPSAPPPLELNLPQASAPEAAAKEIEAYDLEKAEKELEKAAKSSNLSATEEITNKVIRMIKQNRPLDGIWEPRSDYLEGRLESIGENIKKKMDLIIKETSEKLSANCKNLHQSEISNSEMRSICREVKAAIEHINPKDPAQVKLKQEITNFAKQFLLETGHHVSGSEFLKRKINPNSFITFAENLEKFTDYFNKTSSQEERVLIKNLNSTKDTAINDKVYFEQSKKDARTGDAEALYKLGECYLHGRGTQVNFPEAVKCFTKVNSPQAKYVLAQIYARGLHGSEQSEGSVPKNLQKALQLYREAANAGHLTATIAEARIFSPNPTGVYSEIANANNIEPNLIYAVMRYSQFCKQSPWNLPLELCNHVRNDLIRIIDNPAFINDPNIDLETCKKIADSLSRLPAGSSFEELPIKAKFYSIIADKIDVSQQLASIYMAAKNYYINSDAFIYSLIGLAAHHKKNGDNVNHFYTAAINAIKRQEPINQQLLKSVQEQLTPEQQLKEKVASSASVVSASASVSAAASAPPLAMVEEEPYMPQFQHTDLENPNAARRNIMPPAITSSGMPEPNAPPLNILSDSATVTAEPSKSAAKLDNSEKNSSSQKMELENAAKALEKATKSGDANLIYNTGEIYEKHGEIEKAFGCYNLAATNYHHGKSLSKMGDIYNPHFDSEGVKKIRDHYAIQPDSTRAAHFYEQCSNEMDVYSRLIEIANDPTTKPEAYQSILNGLHSFAKEFRIGLAKEIQFYNKLISQYPNGSFEGGLEEIENTATRMLRKTKKNQTTYATIVSEALTSRGDIHKNIGKFAEANRSYEEAIKIVKEKTNPVNEELIKRIQEKMIPTKHI